MKINKNIQSMQERVKNGFDPLSGRLFQVVGSVKMFNGKCTDDTGKKVTLSEFGDWVYATS